MIDFGGQPGKKPGDAVTDSVSVAVTNTVISPIFVARMFDEDKLSNHSDHRFELKLSGDEMQCIDRVAKMYDAGRAGVLRVALRMMLRNFEVKTDVDE